MAAIKTNLHNIQLSNSELLRLVKEKLLLPERGKTIIDGKFYKDVVIDIDGNTKLEPMDIQPSKKMIKHDKLYKKLYKVLIEGK